MAWLSFFMSLNFTVLWNFVRVWKNVNSKNACKKFHKINGHAKTLCPPFTGLWVQISPCLLLVNYHYNYHHINILNNMASMRAVRRRSPSPGWWISLETFCQRIVYTRRQAWPLIPRKGFLRRQQNPWSGRVPRP